MNSSPPLFAPCFRPMCGRFANGVPNANEVERRVAREYFEEDAPEPDWSRPEQASTDEEAAKEHGAGPASSQAASGSQGAGVGTSAVTKTFEWAPGAVFKPRYNVRSGAVGYASSRPLDLAPLPLPHHSSQRPREAGQLACAVRLRRGSVRTRPVVVQGAERDAAEHD